ncbi:F-box only protein 22-like [Stegodyphus dumicola]|uniref:F-box only protein 22-like n=1 Tax=Stegodyphus dumicola TaxID=202533 RepID=UPI0015B19D1C|nr:F-box only protein 22-like [Stegodyphus dumicola]XP_035226643.1 F-box only protein 22-like [Stegodyphus dumicola]XP_035226644.1 F-box only protein 22-like [Stegodyphus dumicola]
MRQVFEAVRIQPYFCIAFATSGYLSSFEKLFPTFRYSSEPAKKKARNNYYLRDYLRAVKEKALKEHLPDQCPVSIIISPGIVGCRKNAVPLEVEEGTALSGLLFPQVPGMEIHHFAVDGRRYNIDKLMPTDASVKCLLVFLTQRGSSIAVKLVQSCLEREDGKVAVGGAIVDRTESLTGTVIAFCGPSVKAASVILTKEDKKEQFEHKLKKFQETDLLNSENKCFAFMFVCVARGFHLHKEHNLESSVFHKLYPNVPLIGLFGNGEIGINYIPSMCENNLDQQKSARYLHSYSTVFVLVSVKV